MLFFLLVIYNFCYRFLWNHCKCINGPIVYWLACRTMVQPVVSSSLAGNSAFLPIKSFSLKSSQISPIFILLNLCTAKVRTSANGGPLLCEKILQCGRPCIGGNCVLLAALSKKPSYFYLIAYYTPIWEVVQTLVFPTKFQGQKIFFRLLNCLRDLKISYFALCSNLS